MKYYEKENEQGDNVINHILENYFNRKSLKPTDYFVDPALAILRSIWEKYHHQISIKSNLKMEKSVSSELPNVSEDLIYSQITKTSKSSIISCLSLDITNDLYKSSQMNEESILELRI